MRATCGDHLSPAVPPGFPWAHMGAGACRRATEQIGAESHGYSLGAIRVISSAENAEYRGLIVPHNHVSVSVALDRRPTDFEMALVRSAFDLADAEEDNHQPGRIRNLFLPLHLPRGTTGTCDCKSDETEVIEADGFRWSKPKVGAGS